VINDLPDTSNARRGPTLELRVVQGTMEGDNPRSWREPDQNKQGDGGCNDKHLRRFLFFHALTQEETRDVRPNAARAIR